MVRDVEFETHGVRIISVLVESPDAVAADDLRTGAAQLATQIIGPIASRAVADDEFAAA